MDVKSILSKIIKDFYSSGQVNLMNSFLREIPKFKSLGHPIVETADIRNIDFASKTKACPNHIKNSELETGEVFERETWSPENIQRALPTDMVTWLDDNQLIRSTDSSKHEETHEPEENQDPESSSSDSSETFSLD